MVPCERSFLLWKFAKKSPKNANFAQVQAPARALDIVAVRLGMRAMQRQLKDQLAEQKEAFYVECNSKVERMFF